MPDSQLDHTETETAVREQLRAVIDEAGGNAAFARKSGIPLSSLNNYLGGTAIKLPVLIKIADASGRSVDQLLGRHTALTRSSSDIPEGFVAVPFLDVRASAGAGRAALPAEVVASSALLFGEAWLRSLGVSPARAELLRAEGDSMFPTIQDGDLMLVDRGFGEVVHGKIYALVINDLVVVKRVNFLAVGGITLISDNDRYPSETVRREDLPSLNFQGRIAWYGRPL